MRVNTCKNCGEVITLVYAPFGDHVLCSDCAKVSGLPLTRYTVECFECGNAIAANDDMIVRQGTRKIQYLHAECCLER